MLEIKNVKIGEGMPKICIPITGRTEEEIKEEVKHILSVPCDMIEWRADFSQELNESFINRTLTFLLTLKKPVIFTLRTKKEGGNADVSPAEYEKAVLTAINAKADIVDSELFSYKEASESIIKAAHKSGVFVIGSYHDFEKTPSEDEMKEILKKAESLGCDIAKIAVMPKTAEDVTRVLKVSNEMGKALSCPISVTAMSKTGIITRLCGELFNSSITFAGGLKPSAPGQPDAEDVYKILNLLH